MASPADITDPTFRAALEEADRLLDEGDYLGVSRKCGETYLLLLKQHPELIPPPPAPLGVIGSGSYATYLHSSGRPSWPRTGGLTIVVSEDKKPSLSFEKERFSFSEAAGYYEFLMNELWQLQGES